MYLCIDILKVTHCLFVVQSGRLITPTQHSRSISVNLRRRSSVKSCIKLLAALISSLFVADWFHLLPGPLRRCQLSAVIMNIQCCHTLLLEQLLAANIMFKAIDWSCLPGIYGHLMG